MNHEFRWGDRVKWSFDADPERRASLGTVVDERNPKTQPIMGDFNECLPVPVAVLWDEPGETWWTPGDQLELA